MYATTHAKKGKADALFKGLAEAADGDYPSWNFHKYIIDRDGQLVGSFGSTGPSSSHCTRHRERCEELFRVCYARVPLSAADKAIDTNLKTVTHVVYRSPHQPT